MFVRFQQAAPHSSLFGYGRGDVCSWKEKCAGESRRGWTVPLVVGSRLGLLLHHLADYLTRTLADDVG